MNLRGFSLSYSGGEGWGEEALYLLPQPGSCSLDMSKIEKRLPVKHPYFWCRLVPFGAVYCRLVPLRHALAASMQFENRVPPHPGPLPKEREPFSTALENSLDGDL